MLRPNKCARRQPANHTRACLNPSTDRDAGGAISNLMVLALAQLHQQLADLQQAHSQAQTLDQCQQACRSAAGSIPNRTDVKPCLQHRHLLCAAQQLISVHCCTDSCWHPTPDAYPSGELQLPMSQPYVELTWFSTSICSRMVAPSLAAAGSGGQSNQPTTKAGRQHGIGTMQRLVRRNSS